MTISYKAIEDLSEGITIHSDNERVYELLKSMGNIKKIEEQDSNLAVFYRGNLHRDFSTITDELYQKGMRPIGFVYNKELNQTRIWFTNVCVDL